MIYLYRKPLAFIIIVFVCTTSLASGVEKKNASLAMLFCVIPGGGQFYTERYIPGIAIATAELAIGYYAYKYNADGDHTKRNSMLWWGLFVFGFSLADAYVGAKMYGFDVEADIDKVSIGYNWEW